MKQGKYRLFIGLREASGPGPLTLNPQIVLRTRCCSHVEFRPIVPPKPPAELTKQVNKESQRKILVIVYPVERCSIYGWVGNGLWVVRIFPRGVYRAGCTRPKVQCVLMDSEGGKLKQ